MPYRSTCLVLPSTMIQYKQSLLWMGHVTSLSSCFRRWPSKEYGTGHTSARMTCLFQSTFIGPGMIMMDGWIDAIKCNDAGIVEYFSTCMSLVSTKDVSCHEDKTKDWWRGNCVFHYHTTAFNMPWATSVLSNLYMESAKSWCYTRRSLIQWHSKHPVMVSKHTHKNRKTLYSMLLFQGIIPMDPQCHSLHDQLQRWWMYNDVETNSTTCYTLSISLW